MKLLFLIALLIMFLVIAFCGGGSCVGDFGHNTIISSDNTGCGDGSSGAGGIVVLVVLVVKVVVVVMLLT